MLVFLPLAAGPWLVSVEFAVENEKEVKLLVSDAFTYTILISHPCSLRRNVGTKEKAFL